MHPGVVSEYEALEAAVAGNYTWTQFTRLSVEDKALCVARYRMHNRIDSVVQQEVTLYMRRKHHG